jgi:hypothetical protein
MCSLLRHAGVPSRVRSGLADYLGSGGLHLGGVVTEWRRANSAGPRVPSKVSTRLPRRCKRLFDGANLSK